MLHDLLHWLSETTQHVVGDYGAWAVFGLMLIESMCIPFPSEVIMLFAGYMVSNGDASLLAVIAAGVIGNLVGSWVAWGVGWKGGRPLVERHGKWLGINKHHIYKADTWFEKHGNATVLVGRRLPVIRTFISLPAGVAKMPFWRFTIYTTIGCIPWVTALALVGVWLGPKWERAETYLKPVSYGIAAVVGITIIWFLVTHIRKPKATA